MPACWRLTTSRAVPCVAVSVALIAGAACGAEADPPFPVTCPGAGDYEYADVVVDAPGTVAAPSAVNEQENAVNGVRGEPDSGSLDVFSRGLSTDPPNHYIVLRWSQRTLEDAPGPDFVVYENAFMTKSGHFMDHAVVEVSSDGEEWVAFPHDYVAEDETRYVADPDAWIGFAGVAPTHYDADDPACESPFAEESGGDRFDLAELTAAPTPVRYLRLTAAPTLENPDTGEPYPRDVIADGFDLDGVYAAQTSSDE